MSEAENCTHECSSCGETCSTREKSPSSLLEAPNEFSSIKKAIGVVSGKGGVGKSIVTALLAIGLNKKGNHTAILDADITGPSIPKIFGISKKAEASAMGILPVSTKTGIDIMSINLLLEKDTDPVVWRGPIIAGTVKQFWTDVVWNAIDVMLIDMPPGTGDVPLTVFQSIPLDGVIIVATPQELVSLIVAKAVKMANMMHVPIIGLVENMSYFECPDCGRKTNIFGNSHVDKVAEEYNVPVLARIPIDPRIAEACDTGTLETLETSCLDTAIQKIEETGKKEQKE